MSFTFVAAFVQAQTAVPVSTILSPVQTFNHKRGAPTQAWLIEVANTPSLFSIQNIVARTFLSSIG
ncbi:hypothetical protein K438DRAFT_1976378 [Mycena galopus ATCC 62051]|nr:hypothetical protein K438DRAFT_1976378 [Mycena galopus ATCC 62051]